MSVATTSPPATSHDLWNLVPGRAVEQGQPERRLRGREIALLSTMASGAPVTVVAERLGISDRTVRRRLRKVCEDIGVHTPIEAVAWAARRRLI